MEGICGIVSFGELKTEVREKISVMANFLSDGEKLSIRCLAGRKWALASGGWDETRWQPITFSFQDEELALVGVADIHNLEELSQIHRTPQRDVGKLLASCYRKYGEEWPARVHGNFAVIVVDLGKQNVYAVTDPIGIRPLYWSKVGDHIFLSSRIGAIRQVAPSSEIEPRAIYAYLHHSMVPSPYTIYQNVWKIEPGCFFKADANISGIKRYWDISNLPKLHGSEEEISEEIYERLDRSVALFSGDIVPKSEIACFLSGGTDSSSICGLLAKRSRNKVDAYSIGFPENGYDEMYYAHVAAETFGLEHHKYYIRPGDVIDLLPRIISAYDEPFGNASAVPAYYGAKSANENGVQYLLAGDGGDEIFAGNERYSLQQLFRNYKKIPRPIRTALFEPLLLNRLEKLPIEAFRKAGSYVRRANMPEVARIHSYRYVSDAELFTTDFLNAHDFHAIEQIAEKHFNALQEASVLDRHLYMDMKLTITDNDLRKVSRTCDLAQVRVRYPMLDRSVVDLGFRIPSRLKLKGTSGLRYIFKRAFRDLLPPEILKKKKHGFGLPISEWLRSDPKIKTFAMDLLFDSRHLQRGYFRKDFVQRLWDLHSNDDTPYYGTILWQMVMLEGWHRVHEEGKTL